MTSDEADLFAAVLRDPFDLTLRKVHADALRDRAAEGDWARADFIEAQLREPLPPTAAQVERAEHLGGALLAEHYPEWLGQPNWQRPYQPLMRLKSDTLPYCNPVNQLETRLHITPPTAEYVCWPFAATAYWAMGFCAWLRVPTWATFAAGFRPVFERHPVVGVICAGFTPAPVPSEGGRGGRWRARHGDDAVAAGQWAAADILPAAVFGLLPSVIRRPADADPPRVSVVYYFDADQARYELERAITDWARAEVGLPPLPLVPELRHQPPARTSRHGYPIIAADPAPAAGGDSGAEATAADPGDAGRA